MPSELSTSETQRPPARGAEPAGRNLVPAGRAEPARRYFAAELVLVFLVAAAVLAPGIWRYSLVDPWETHYGEVAREMLEEHDLVHTHWRGTFYSNPGDNEGFRSKPVLMFWMMAAGLQAVGVGDDGGYSGEMVQDARTMLGIRLPFVLSAIAGLMLMWWMLARLVSRRLAWLALLVVGSTPMFCLIARQGIPDMPMTACTMGAIALFILAVEDGARPIEPIRYLFRRRVAIDARHVVFAITAGFVVLQAAYLVAYFVRAPQLAIRGAMPHPALWLPGLTLLLVAALSRDGWVILRLPFVLVGGIIAAIVNEPMPQKRREQTLWRHVVDDILYVWDRHALDKYVFRVLPPTLIAAVIVMAWTAAPLTLGELWRTSGRIVDRLFAMGRITTMRQLYLLGAYFLLGISILAKGPPGFTVVAGVMAFHVLLLWRWRPLWDGDYEIKRALLMIIAVVLPWHMAMYLKDGVQFVDQYIFQHILNRAGDGSVDKSLGTFAWLATGGGGYTTQIGHGMWLWAALLPAALVGAFGRASRLTREGRVRFVITLWAVIAVFVFCFVQTKFHHYILPAIPPLALLVAWLLDDLVARRERLHPVLAAVAIGIVLLVCRDLMFEPERWIEMFVYRYDRPWPSGEPYRIDPSDGYLALAIAAVIGLALMATRFVRIGVTVVGTVGLAICIWALQVYMPLAGTHWGMRDAVRSYYEQRTIYGHKRVFFGAGQCADGLRAQGDSFGFETFIPDTLHPGQPLALTVELRKASDDKVVEQTVTARGEAVAIGHHDVRVRLFPGERAKLEALRAECARRVDDYHARLLPAYRKAFAAWEQARAKRAGKPPPPPRAPDPLSGRRPIAIVDADRLIAWQLYWRGENFWSGGEIWGWLPEQKTSFVPVNNTELLKYLNDRTRAPLGRRMFLITEAGRITTVKSLLPTQRARETYEVIDTTSNKFSIAAFYL